MVLGQARRQIRYLLLKLSLATHSIIDISEPSPEARSLLALSFWPLIGQESCILFSDWSIMSSLVNCPVNQEKQRDIEGGGNGFWQWKYMKLSFMYWTSFSFPTSLHRMKTKRLYCRFITSFVCCYWTGIMHAQYFVLINFNIVLNAVLPPSNTPWHHLCPALQISERIWFKAWQLKSFWFNKKLKWKLN